MAEEDGLLALQNLHSDLIAFSEHRLHDIDRLISELELQIEDFRALLDKKGKSEPSRKKVFEGTVEIGDVQYQLNDEFKQQAVEVAEELDLDEIEAVKLLLQSQEEAVELDRSATACAIIRFHKRRQFLLECLRLVITVAQVDGGEEDSEFAILELKRRIINARDGQVGNGPKYWQKCFQALQEMETLLHRLAERSQRISVIGHSLSEEALELLDFESMSLLQQHESLATIAALLVKDDDEYTEISNFKSVLGRAKAIDKHDLIMVHYLPILLAFIVLYGDAESKTYQGPLAEELNSLILAQKDSEQWSLRPFHAATYVWWNAEYFSKWKPDGSEAEKRERDEVERFNKALQDGALHFMLSVAAETRKPDWYDPAKAGLISFLLQDATHLNSDSPRPAAHFQRLLLDQLQFFVDAFVTNMPNTLRDLKNDEDKQRRELLARFQKNPSEYQYHLERFLVLVSLAYEDSPEGAHVFWEDPDGNLYGFLQWAAKRQTTPRVAAFCEMMSTLSESEENANAAHRFLLEEGSPVAGKLRRTGSLSWNQIYAEVFFYAKTIRDRPSTIVQSTDYAGSISAQDVVEPESAIMLECYLRLITQLCRSSSQARAFVLEWQHEAMTLRDILFQLASSQIDSRLRACAFTTLGSLLTNKTRELSDAMWVKLDAWISGGASPTGSQLATRPAARVSPSWSESAIFDIIGAGFEEANAFLSLLNALIAPSAEELGLNDALPYPENLGSAYRMPGIDSFVDFAVGKVFGERTAQLTDQTHLRLLRLNALDFIATCLSTFNEDLVVVANRVSFPVDQAMHTSSLEAYVRNHPFARVMEWLFNDRVLDAIFSAAHQDVSEVNATAADTPLVLSLVRSVEVMNLILRYQPTYIDVVRPQVKSRSPARRSAIAHSAIATFEDALVGNLDIVVNLGLYCGTGHQELTLASLSLLEKLSSSKKLVVSPAAGFGKFSDRSKLIGVFEKNDDSDRVARSLMSELRIDPRELEARQSAPGYVIKISTLSFLKNCLLALPEQPTLAHLLLGFVCRVRELDIAPDGLFAQGASLFHAIAALAVEYPEVGPVPVDLPPFPGASEELLQNPNAGMPSYFAWLSNIREACTEILWQLWRSRLSSALVMTDLRSSDFIFALAVQQGITGPSTLWDGVSIKDEHFLKTEGTIGLRNFLRQRAAFYDYLAREIRVSAEEKMEGLRDRLQGVILGQVKLPGQESVPCPTIYDLFDFMELEIPMPKSLHSYDYFGDIDFEGCRDGSQYDIACAQQLMLLRRNELEPTLAAGDERMREAFEATFASDFQNVLLYLNALNQRHILLAVHTETLRYWTQLVAVAIESCTWDPATKSSFALQILQLILPKLERAFAGYDATALSTAHTLLRLIQILMNHVGLDTKGETKVEFGNDRVFNVFRTALSGIYADITTFELREVCYGICYRYLLSIASAGPSKGSPANRHVLRAVKLAGERLLDVVCDDAYSGEGRTRVTALLLLDSLVVLSNTESSRYLLEGFSRLNFVGVLLDTLKCMPNELSEAASTGEDTDRLLTTYHTLLPLLLHISLTPNGSSALLSSGLFPALSASRLFTTDPDLGFSLSLDDQDPAALFKFFSLMLAVLKLVVSVFLAKGTENAGLKKEIRVFLTKARGCVLAVFKRNAGVGGAKGAEADVLGELVDMFGLLIAASGWLEFEDSMTKSQRSRLTVFS